VRNYEENIIKKRIVFILAMMVSFGFVLAEKRFEVKGNVYCNRVPIKNISVMLIGFINDKQAFHFVEETGSEGDFSFLVKNGDYEIKIQPGNGYVGLDNGRQIHVENNIIEKIVLLLKKACRLSGRVEYEDKTAVSGARIDVISDNGIFLSKTDKEGNYVMDNIRSSGHYQVKVRADGFQEQKKSEIVFKQEGDSLAMNFTFNRQGKKYCGRVIDSKTKKGIYPVALILINSEGTPRKIMSAGDENGNFCFFNLEPGKYELGVSSPVITDLIQTFDLIFTDSANKVYEIETVLPDEQVEH
jgi:hypothetical protein